MAKGGIVPKYFANGGLAQGTDTVPAMLTPGEVVLNAGQQSNVADAINSPMVGGSAGALAGTGGTGASGDDDDGVTPTDPLAYLRLLIKKQREATAVAAEEKDARMSIMGEEGAEGTELVRWGEAAKTDAVEDGEKGQDEARKRGTAAQKATSIIGAGIAVALGITKALSLMWPLNLVMAAVVGAMGAAQIANIASAKSGGMITHAGVDVSEGGKLSGAGTGTSDSIPAMLSNGEYIIKAVQARKYVGVLAAINSGKDAEVMGR